MHYNSMKLKLSLEIGRLAYADAWKELEKEPKAVIAIEDAPSDTQLKEEALGLISQRTLLNRRENHSY